MEKSRIAEISAKDTFPLRSLVLRNRNPSIECPFDGDLEPTTRHFGVLVNGQIVTIASFYFITNEVVGKSKMLQLRGMATHPDFVGRGFGKALVEHVISIYKESEVRIIWCNAREVAFGFYSRIGFKGVGENFLIPQIGVHRVMYIEI